MEEVWGGVGYGVKHHFKQHFSYIVAVSFIGGGNWSTQRKTLTCRKSVTHYYHIMLHRVHLSMTGIRTQNFSQRQCQNTMRIVYITLRQYNLVYVKTVKTYCMPPRQINNNLNAMEDKLSTFNENESELSLAKGIFPCYKLWTFSTVLLQFEFRDDRRSYVPLIFTIK